MAEWKSILHTDTHWMGKTSTLSIFIFLLFSSVNLVAQTGKDIRLSDFRTWDFGTSAGLTFPRTDISGKTKFGITFDGTKFLSQHFAVNARLVHATLAGEDINRPEYLYHTTVNYDFTLNVILQSGELILLPSGLRDRFAMYISAGAGIIHYSPDIWLDGGRFKMHGIYSQYSQEYDTFDYRGNTDFVLPVCAGVKYRLNDRLSLSLEYTYRVTNSDELDGYFKLLSNNDNYSMLNAGVVIHLGKKSKVLQWENTTGSDNSEADSLRAKLYTYIKDTDGDGVPDIRDKEPSTPPGTKVYGDGTSVDTDADGVPDSRDQEPYSERNAKVDVNGKQIKPVQAAVTAPVKKEVAFPPVYFGYDSSRINRQYYEALGKIAEQMLSNPNAKYRVVAICDDATKAYNSALAHRRAESVKKHLVKYYNIRADRLSTEIEFVPPDPALTEKNRRVEVRERQ